MLFSTIRAVSKQHAWNEDDNGTQMALTKTDRHVASVNSLIAGDLTGFRSQPLSQRSVGYSWRSSSDVTIHSRACHHVLFGRDGGVWTVRKLILYIHISGDTIHSRTQGFTVSLLKRIRKPGYTLIDRVGTVDHADRFESTVTRSFIACKSRQRQVKICKIMMYFLILLLYVDPASGLPCAINLC